MIANRELISIVVAVYNSSKFIEETLNSIYTQKYKNIELIICDDCSIDNSVEIINSWLENIDINRFFKINLIIQNKNLGLTKNINLGIKSAQGEWIKCLGGDDILMIDCLEILFRYAKKDSCDILFGQIKNFYTDKRGEKKFYEVDSSKKIQQKFMLSKESFFKELIQECFLPAPAAFFSKKVWIELDGFDERYKMVEDWPFWLKAVQKNKKISFVDKVVVLYREHEDSITSKKLTSIDSIIGNQARLDMINFSYDFRRHYILNPFEKWEIINLYYSQKISKINLIPIRRVCYLLFRATSPVYIKNLLKQKIQP